MKIFTMIMLDIRDITEKDKLFFFLDGLSHDATIGLQRKRIQNLVNAVTAVERLSNYNIGFPTSMKSQGSTPHSSNGKGSQSSRSGKSKNGRGSNGLAP